MELLREAVARAESGESLALVTVVRVWGSAPRHMGAKMLVTEDGDHIGTIGGGRVELEVTRAAIDVARGGPARRVKHHLVRDLAMCCGGNMEFYVEPVAASCLVLRQAAEAVANRRPMLLITPLDGSPKEIADMPAGMTRHPKYEQERFVEPLWPRDRIVLFGAGHVARKVGPLAAQLGFEIVLCDDGETGALTNVADARWVSRIVESFDVRDVEADIGPLGVGDYAVVMTREHALDQGVLEQLLPNDALTFIGLIGSRGKVGRFRKRLAAKGIATEERWSRLHAPIGLDIGAETPEEIAVATVAQLIQLRRRGRS